MMPPDAVFVYATILVFLFGACIGSFLNVCIYRIPLEQSVVRPGSHCFRCGKPVRWFDNVPIVSYLVLRGQCRDCGERFSPRYALVELLTAGLFVAIWLVYAGGPGSLTLDPRVPVYWLFVSGLILGTFVDFDHLIIPDRVSIGGMIAGVLLSLLVPRLHDASLWWQGGLRSLMGLGCGYLLLWGVARLGEVLFKKEAMGYGDVKLMGAIGAFLGWPGVLFTILFSSLFGSVVGLTLVLLGGREWQSRIPYGPYIALAAVAYLFCGEALWSWYLGLLTGRPWPEA